MVKELSDGVTETQIHVSHKIWKKQSLEKIIYDNGVRALHAYNASPNQNSFFIFFVYIFIHNLESVWVEIFTDYSQYRNT